MTNYNDVFFIHTYSWWYETIKTLVDYFLFTCAFLHANCPAYYYCFTFLFNLLVHFYSPPLPSSIGPRSYVFIWEISINPSLRSYFIGIFFWNFWKFLCLNSYFKPLPDVTLWIIISWSHCIVLRSICYLQSICYLTVSLLFTVNVFFTVYVFFLRNIRTSEVCGVPAIQTPGASFDRQCWRAERFDEEMLVWRPRRQTHSHWNTKGTGEHDETCWIVSLFFHTVSSLKAYAWLCLILT